METADDDEGSNFGGAFEGGHWEWDTTAEELVFVSDLAQLIDANIAMPKKLPTGAVEFRDDVDLLEQIRFRRRYQRKVKIGQPEIISLQDIKDVALFTAPVSILSPGLINLLHIPTTERFLRALIFCCQYYLQISEEMIHRTLELTYKVRTPICDVLENEFRDNICDLRVLVAKEYCTMLIGGSDTKKFHHMGPLKKRRSLSDKDARMTETFIRMSVQIVWLALGRKCFNQIELEVNRLFKSDIFNTVEHTLKTGYLSKMTKQEQNVLLGTCLRHDKKLTTRSPFINEVFCHRSMDYRLTGLGVIKYETMTRRLRYLERVIALPEQQFSNNNIVCGILGMPRSSYDTMLRALNVPTISAVGGIKSSATSVHHYSISGGTSTIREPKKSQQSIKIYPDIVLPDKFETDDSFPDHFPDTPEIVIPSNDGQRKRWQARLVRLLHPTTNRMSTV